MKVTETERELAQALNARKDLDKDTKIGCLLSMARGNENSESNCRAMIKFLKTNPNREQIEEEIDKILGIYTEDEE